MIPLKSTLRSRAFPFVTTALVLANLFIFFEQVRAGAGSEKLIFAFGLVPARLTHWTALSGPSFSPLRFLPLFTSMFFHGGFLHLLGNLLYLWVFGDNVEDKLGHTRFAVFYLLCGLAAASLQLASAPDSTVPMIGASGAIAGVLGGSLVAFPRARIVTLVPIFFFPWIVQVPAVVFLLLWFVTQLLLAVAGFGREFTGGVAVWAHVGGFVSGVLLMLAWPPRGRRSKAR